MGQANNETALNTFKTNLVQDEVQAASWEKVITALRSGKAAIIPTDTVYGLAVAPAFSQSPQLLYELKQRPSNKPVSWLVGSPEDLELYGENVPVWASQLAKKYWPGPLTLVVRASPKVPQAYRSATGSIGLRMPAHSAVVALVHELGCPLATTSANMSGQSDVYKEEDLSPQLLSYAPVLLCAASSVFPQRGNAASMDSSPLSSGVASTVVDCTGAQPVILREGEIPAKSIVCNGTSSS